MRMLIFCFQKTKKVTEESDDGKNVRAFTDSEKGNAYTDTNTHTHQCRRARERERERERETSAHTHTHTHTHQCCRPGS